MLTENMKMKTGLDYFPIDVDWLSDDKLTTLIADYGNAGLGVLMRLLSEIYRNGYCLPWAVINQKRFSVRHGVPASEVVEIVRVLVADGFFDQGMASGEAPVLTSIGIQKRWRLASSRRAAKEIDPAINLLEEEASARSKMSTKESKMYAIEPELHTFTTAQVGLSETECLQSDALSRVERGEMLTFTLQSKGKKSRGKESKEKKTQQPTFPASLDTEEHRLAWGSFIEHRVRIRKPYRSIESQNAQLQLWSDRPSLFIGAIALAIANEWQGLHEPSAKNKNSTTGITGISARTQRALDLIKKFDEQEA